MNNLLKLALGTGAGYLGASLILPNRGFANNYPSYKGVDCRHITNDMIKSMSRQELNDWQQACNLSFDQQDTLWRHATSDPHGALIGLPWQTASDASSWPAGAPGAVGGGFPNIGKALSGIPFPILIGGALVIVLLVVMK